MSVHCEPGPALLSSMAVWMPLKRSPTGLDSKASGLAEFAQRVRGSIHLFQETTVEMRV